MRQQFTQKERDNETGLDYFGARYFASMQGRFTSPDPLLSSGKPLQPQSWNRYSYCINDPLKYVDPKGLVWGQWDDDNGKRHYHWFDGKIGKYNGHDYSGVPELARGGSSLLIHADNGELVRIRNSGIVRAVEGRWAAAPVINPAQAQLNQRGGLAHGVGHALTAVNPLASPLVDAAIDHLIGGVDKSDPGYHNAAAIGNGLMAAPLILTPVPEAEAAEGITLFHGSDAVSVENMLEHGINATAAAEKGGGDTFWTTSSLEDAQWFAASNPSGGAPAVMRIDLSQPAVHSLMHEGTLQVEGSVYQFSGSAWQKLNDLGKFSRVP